MFNKLFGKKKATGVEGVKKNIQTADSIISSAVKKSGNISGVTLSKQEQQALLKRRKKVPIYIILLKYISIILLAVSLGGFLYLKADINKENKYLGLLGLQDNVGKFHAKVKKENFELKKTIKNLENEIEDFEYRLDNNLYGKYSDLVEEVRGTQRTWFTSTNININTDTGKSELTTSYGILDSVDEMIQYFRSADKYFTLYFAKREKEQSGDNYKECKNPNISMSQKEKLLCPKPAEIYKYDMINEIELKNISITDSNASINISVNDLLNKNFTLGSEFVEMMNSFSFFKNAEIKNFSQQKNSTGVKSMNMTLRLELQNKDEVDPADENFIFFETWKKYNKIQQLRKNRKTKSNNSTLSDTSSNKRVRPKKKS